MTNGDFRPTIGERFDENCRSYNLKIKKEALCLGKKFKIGN